MADEIQAAPAATDFTPTDYSFASAMAAETPAEERTGTAAPAEQAVPATAEHLASNVPASEAPTTEATVATPAEAPEPPAAPEIPEALRAQWDELQARAERADKFAPVLDDWEKQGIADADALTQRQAQTAEQQQLQSHFQQARGQFYTEAMAEVSADIDAAVERGEISEQYAETLKEQTANLRADAALREYQTDYQQRAAQQTAAVEQFQSDARQLLAQDEYKIEGQPLPANLFAAYASVLEDAPLSEVAKVVYGEMMNFRNAIITNYQAQQAKNQQAPRPMPQGGGAGVPAAPVFDEQNVSLRGVMAYEENLARQMANQ